MRLGWLVVIAACGYPRPADVSDTQRISGRVHGLWDGADGVTLRLLADGVDTLLSVAANGAFELAQPVARGASYTVTVVTSPAGHTCRVVSGGSGTVSDAAPPEVSIGCAGPATVTLTGPWAWTFDSTEEVQTFAGSVAAQDVALAIGGTGVLTARVADQPVTVGQLSSRIRLGLGTTMVPVALTAGGGLSKTYQLAFQRGAALLDQVAYGKASNTASDQDFGYTLAMYEDTLAIGAIGEASKATGVNGDQTDTSSNASGAVYVFVRQGTAWTQQAYLKASNTGSDDGFGASLALYGDTLAVGAMGESSSAPGINGDQSNNSAIAAGAVYVFVRSGVTWAQQAYIKASNPDQSDLFGSSVALYGDTLAVGAQNEASSATGVNPPNGQADNTAPGTGAVYLYTRSGATWSQRAYLKPSNKGGGFGISVALSGDTLAVGAYQESSNATGVNGNQADQSARAAGAVYVFVRTSQSWAQQAYIKASNTDMFDQFGTSVALSGDTLVVGAPEEASSATGVDPVDGQRDNSAQFSGAVYVFVRHTVTWTQEAYIKPSNTGSGDDFGHFIALSGDMLVVGARGESSIATGIDGDQSDNSALVAGAAYVFARTGTTWSQRAYVKASNTGLRDVFGSAVAASHDTIAIGAPSESSRATGIDPENGQGDNSARAAGAVYIFR